MINKEKMIWKICVIIIIQFCICIYVGTEKKSFFCDEIYSYGLANSEAYSFIDPESARQYSSTGWVEAKYFKNYVEVSEDQKLSFAATVRNQINDVHPPFYYCLLHLICYFFRGHFSKWTGLGLNLIILFFIDIFFLYITNYLFRDMKKAILAMIFWSCSAAGLSNILFIRMYLLQTCQILAFVAVHIRVIKCGQIKFQKLDYILMLLLVVSGGLTQYYFYYFVFFFSGVLCVYFLISRQIVKLIKYSASLLGGFVSALLIFPYTINHVLSGYRGTEVLSNLSERDSDVFNIYYNWINQSSFGGYIKVLFIGVVICAFWGVLNKYLVTLSLGFEKSEEQIIIDLERKNRMKFNKCHFEIRLSYIVVLWMFFSYVMFGYLVVKGSSLVHNRYLYPVYPMVAIVLMGLILFCIRQIVNCKIENEILLGIILLMCVLSVRTYGIDFMYKDYDLFREQAEQVQGYDCLLWYGDSWLDTYTALPLKLIYDETYFLHPNEIKDVSEILNLRESYNPVVVCLPDQYTAEEAEVTLSQISEAGGFTGYRLIYHYYTQAYLME